MQTEKIYNGLLAQKLIEEFELRNFEGFYCETKEQAKQTILDMISPSALVSCGGSQTIQQIGLRDALHQGEYNFLDPLAVQGSGAMDEIAHRALQADYFIMGANAITEAGELVNMDGYGNRVASLIFGPKQVIVVAGLNKVEPTLEAAILRVKTYAARMVLLLFNQAYSSFAELDQAAQTAGSHLVVTNRAPVKGRIKVILVGESLGF